jgi:hypothetical protein
MKFLILLLFIFCLHFSQIFSQNTISIGTQSYNSTREWQCTVKDGYPEIGSASLCLAKGGKGGYFVVSVETHHPLKGSIFIYLKDGSIIKCLDTQKKDQHDGYSIGIYNLTNDEITKLKNSTISHVRVTCFMYGYDNYSFTINNLYNQYIENSTKDDVQKLF